MSAADGWADRGRGAFTVRVEGSALCLRDNRVNAIPDGEKILSPHGVSRVPLGTGVDVNGVGNLLGRGGR